MKKHVLLATIMLLAVAAPGGGPATAPAKKEPALNSDLFSGLKFRSIGPAFTSGRIADFAVNPANPKQYFVAVASGHIWKTDNAGITWAPVFDNYGAYSMGCLAMDPTNPSVVWAGTGENNHQRALGYGDGVYKTVDGGKSWKNMGLKESRQIGMILIDPRASRHRLCGGRRLGLGPGRRPRPVQDHRRRHHLEKVLHISENTGVNGMVMDPRDPDVIIASSEQRRRHVHTKIGGGPETAIHKTTDGGKTWRKLTSGLPTGGHGRHRPGHLPGEPRRGLCHHRGGRRRGRLFPLRRPRRVVDENGAAHRPGPVLQRDLSAIPCDVNKVYSVETVSQVTLDGGKTWRRWASSAAMSTTTPCGSTPATPPIS